MKTTGQNISWLEAIPADPDLIDPVNDARMILADWSEQKIRTKSVLAVKNFIRWHDELMSTDRTPWDDLNLLGPLDVVGTLHDHQNKSTGMSLQQAAAVYLLSKAFNEDSSLTINAPYYLAKFEAILNDARTTDEKNKQEVNASSQKHFYSMKGKKGGNNSGKTRQESAQEDYRVIQRAADERLARNQHPRNIAPGIHSAKLQNLHGVCFSMNKIREALKRHPTNDYWRKTGQQKK